jgi:5-hydroxyisourate hydrolase-like protein (transthyretin family)
VVSSYQNLLTHRATKHFDISGKVTDTATGKPLVGVQVSNGTSITTTDYDGKYGFAKLVNGIYELTFAFADYKTAFASPKFTGMPLVIDQVLEKM